MLLQGNYDAYVQTRLELEENQMKKFRWEQDQIAHMKVCPLYICLVKLQITLSLVICLYSCVFFGFILGYGRGG